MPGISGAVPENTSSPEARNYFPQPEIYQKYNVRYIFLIMWLLLYISINICQIVQISSEIKMTQASKFETDFPWLQSGKHYYYLNSHPGYKDCLQKDAFAMPIDVGILWSYVVEETWVPEENPRNWTVEVPGWSLPWKITTLGIEPGPQASATRPPSRQSLS